MWAAALDRIAGTTGPRWPDRLVVRSEALVAPAREPEPVVLADYSLAGFRAHRASAAALAVPADTALAAGVVLVDRTEPEEPPGPLTLIAAMAVEAAA